MMIKDKESKARGTITFYADPELKQKLHEFVKVKDMNVSQFIRKLIRREVGGDKARKAQDSNND